MHFPYSLTPLLALLALTPCIAATPTPQSSDDVINPIPTPDFSKCNFLQVIDTSIEGPFTLTLLSDTLPLQEWPVYLDASAGDILSPYITKRSRLFPPKFTLTNGLLNITEESRSGRFVPSTVSKPLQELVFGGQGDPSDFYAIQNCDATATQYTELKAGRGE